MRRSRPAVIGQLPCTPGVYRFRDAGGRVLYVGRASTPQVRKGMIMVASCPQRDERALSPDEPNQRAMAGPFNHLRQRQADGSKLPGQIRCHWLLPTPPASADPFGLWKPTCQR